MKQVDGYFIDEKTGLSLPIGLRQVTIKSNIISPARGGEGKVEQTKRGVQMSLDPDSGIAIWPNYGSGWDDLLNRGIAAGTMANGAMTPVINEMITAIVSKIQMIATTWFISLRGKASPTQIALSIINAAEDGDGPHDFIHGMTGSYLTDNRGVMVSFVPIGKIDYDSWAEYGMATVPLEEGKEKYRVLVMDTPSFRENRGLWLVDALECLPTGVPDFPYWIRKDVRIEGGGKKDVWVLVPRQFGTQLLHHVGSKTSTYAGLGTSPVWGCAPYAVKGMAIDRIDWEAMGNSPGDAIVWASGLDAPDQLNKGIVNFKLQSQESGVLLYPGTYFAGTINENSKISIIPLSSMPSGYNAEQWDSQAAQAISANFHVSPIHVRAALIKGGSIEDLMNALEGEASMSYMRSRLQSTLNLATPPSVYIKVIPRTDSQLHRQMETFAVFSLGITRVQKQFGMTENKEDQVVSPLEVRALMEQEIGIKIPKVGADIETVDVREPEDIEASYVSDAGLVDLTSLRGDVDDWCAPGRIVADQQGRVFVSTGQYSGHLLWCTPAIGIGEWLLDIRGLRTLPEAAATPPTEFGFTPDGEPLDEPKDAKVTNWGSAISDAEGLWSFLFADTPYVNLLTQWEWDNDLRTWIDPESGNVLTELETAEIRNQLTDLGGEYEKANVKSDTNRLIALLVTLGGWETGLRFLVRDMWIALWLFGRGGQENLTDTDKTKIEAQLFAQYQFLNGFSRDIATGELSEATIRNRATLYYTSSAGAHERGRLAAFNEDMELPCHPGDCSSECCARCGCFWIITSEDGLIKAVWQRTKEESCATCLRREECDEITFDPETGEYTGVDCYIEEQ